MATINIPSADKKSDLLRSERIAGGILPKVLNSFDMVAIFIAIVLWIPNSAVMTGAGPAAYFYWGLGFITFSDTGGYCYWTTGVDVSGGRFHLCLDHQGVRQLHGLSRRLLCLVAWHPRNDFCRRLSGFADTETWHSLWSTAAAWLGVAGAGYYWHFRPLVHVLYLALSRHAKSDERYLLDLRGSHSADWPGRRDLAETC